jgi:bleomycin hydrolase
MKRLFYLLLVLLFAGCSSRPSQTFSVEVLNSYTPVKNQGKKQTCWVYAMLAAIETEHIMRGDSVHLSVAWVEHVMAQEKGMPESMRGMGATLLQLIQRYGVVPYDAMKTADDIPPKHAFMLGATYSPLEFAHSVCAPDEYIALTSNADEPYYQYIDINLPDNWLHNRFYNIPMDSLLAKTQRAVRQHHGVCWESERHAMAIVGIGHNEKGAPGFVMKNSWGSNRPNDGLDFLSFKSFTRKTLAVEMTREAYGQ